MSDRLLMTNDAARLLERAGPTVRYYERIGRLPAQRTADGTRLFKEEDVMKLKKELDGSKGLEAVIGV
ncbi:hypothetical protein W02_38350 [Nitrospira sp. KM1]|uniref:MerR family transcriptional regulator n=1 Tax=Nitrospira sp. KM1 TaxID=1936990 RepID=UPI0013A719F4|nr:MerR family transcriptional regulator [Nitrospira sp. KM1]BCA56695.1 hypothetical protein W02_38350 [Nitrospira sp. KM1]